MLSIESPAEEEPAEPCAPVAVEADLVCIVDIRISTVAAVWRLGGDLDSEFGVIDDPRLIASL